MSLSDMVDDPRRRSRRTMLQYDSLRSRRAPVYPRPYTVSNLVAMQVCADIKYFPARIWRNTSGKKMSYS